MAEESKIADLRFLPLVASLRALYDSDERKLSDYFVVGFIATNDVLRKVYYDISLVEVEELGEEIVYSGLAYQDLKHLVEVGVLKETKVDEQWGGKLVKDLDGYEITMEGLQKAHMIFKNLGYPADVMPPL